MDIYRYMYIYIYVIAIFKRPVGDLATAFVLHQWLLLARRLWFRPMPGSCECLQLHAGGAKLDGFVLVSALTFFALWEIYYLGIYRQGIYIYIVLYIYVIIYIIYIYYRHIYIYILYIYIYIYYTYQQSWYRKKSYSCPEIVKFI